MKRYQHIPVRAGTLTLLITTVLLCMAVLAALSLSTARADLAMADKSLQNLQEIAEAERAGQAWLAQADAAFKAGEALDPEAVRQQDGTFTVDLELESGNTLHLVLRQEEDGCSLVRWQVQSEWDPAHPLTVWDGL